MPAALCRPLVPHSVGVGRERGLDDPVIERTESRRIPRAWA